MVALSNRLVFDRLDMRLAFDRGRGPDAQSQLHSNEFRAKVQPSTALVGLWLYCSVKKDANRLSESSNALSKMMVLEHDFRGSPRSLNSDMLSCGV